MDNKCCKKPRLWRGFKNVFRQMKLSLSSQQQQYLYYYNSWMPGEHILHLGSSGEHQAWCWRWCHRPVVSDFQYVVSVCFIWQPRGVTPWPKMVSWCTCCPMMGIYSTPPTVKFTRTWPNLSVTTWCHPHTIPISWKISSQVQAAQKPISGNVCACSCLYVCERLTSFLKT